MATKFDKIIEHIINEDHDSARKLFHDVVVEKCRTIYENMDENFNHEPEDLMNEVDVDENTPFMQEEDEEGDPTDGEGIADGADGGDLESDEFADHDDFDDLGGDEADDLTTDTFVDHDGDTSEEEVDDEFGDDFDDEHEGDEEESHEDEAEVEDRVIDLEDAVDELKAEFEKLMADEDTEEDDEDEESENVVREYVDKVPDSAKAGKTEVSGTNTKSIVAGKNDMGGTAKNIAQGGTEKGRPAPSTKPVSSEKFQNAAGGDKKLKPAPKPDRTKESEGTNKKSVY
jgi:hypothetical protein